MQRYARCISLGQTRNQGNRKDNTMHRERLDRQIAVLREVAASERVFDMRNWIEKPRSHEGACGTSACAFGYGALDPQLRAEGLRMAVGFTKEGNDEKTYVDVASKAEYNALVMTLTPDELGTLSAYPEFGGLSGFEAAVEFFGITE